MIWLAAIAAIAAAKDEGAPPSQAALEGALAEAVRAACPRLAWRVDAALSRAARAFARAVEEGRAPPSGAALGFFAALESPEPNPAAGVATIEPAAGADRAVGDLFSRSCRFNRAGVAAGRYRDGAIVALLTAQHETELASLPGTAEPGEAIVVSGRLPEGLGAPRLYVLRPGGRVEQRDLTRNSPPLPEGRFWARVALDEKGEHAVQLLAEGKGGPRVLALRRIFVGVDPPEAPPPELRRAGGDPGLDGVAAAVTALRVARGLPPLIRDAGLDAVAEGHSRAMAKERAFAHVLDSDGTLGDRLFKAGYAYRFAAENIGLAETAMAAHEAVSLSPAHLANLLDPRHRRFGLGAVRGTSPEGEAGVYLTEVFTLPVVGLDDPAGALLGLVAAERGKRSLPPLRRDRRLDAVAEREVRSAAMFKKVPRIHDAASRAQTAAPELTAIEAQLMVGADPSQALRWPAIADGRWTRIGVGAIYANAESAPGQLWMIIVLGR